MRGAGMERSRRRAAGPVRCPLPVGPHGRATVAVAGSRQAEIERRSHAEGKLMAGSVNKVILVGHLGADPEVRTLPSGGKVANFSVATSERWTDKNSGEKKERTEWHRVAVFGNGESGGLAVLTKKYLKK